MFTKDFPNVYTKMYAEKSGYMLIVAKVMSNWKMT